MASDGIGVAAAADMLLGAVTAAEKSSEDAQALSLARSQAFHTLRSLLLALRDTRPLTAAYIVLESLPNSRSPPSATGWES